MDNYPDADPTRTSWELHSHSNSYSNNAYKGLAGPGGELSLSLRDSSVVLIHSTHITYQVQLYIV